MREARLGARRSAITIRTPPAQLAPIRRLSAFFQLFGYRPRQIIAGRVSRNRTNKIAIRSPIKMASLKRSLESDPVASSISSKVYVRSTRSGKVQKIVREVYLRQDIPCSSKLCLNCLKNAPRDAAGNGRSRKTFCPLNTILTTCSTPVCPVREAGRDQGVPTGTLFGS